MASSISKRARMVLLGSVVLTLAVYIIPFGRIVGYPFLLLSTLVHEMGHGITAAAVGAHFHSFHMWPDGSGVANIGGVSGRVSQAAVAAGGLVGPAIAAAMLFTVGRNTTLARISLGILGALLIVAELLVVRGMFAWVFVAILAGACLAIARQRREWLAQLTVVFLAVQLACSVFSRSDYLFTPVAHTSRGPMPSDVAMMAQALVLPYWFWGGLCALFSVAVLWAGLRHFCRA